MWTRLTHIGHRYLQERCPHKVNQVKQLPLDIRILYQHRERILMPLEISDITDQLIQKKWLEPVEHKEHFAETALRYQRNPLEHIHTINFEMTTRCNLSCLHCRSGIVRRATETNIEALKQAAELFLTLGVTHFIFIGGEVSKYGAGWLELTSHIRDVYTRYQKDIPSRHWNGLEISLLTSGWWLEQTHFEAAGMHYHDDQALMQDWKEAGLKNLLFSVDGPQDVHDRWRKVPGLYQRIVRGIRRVRECGLNPQISTVLESQEHIQHGYGYIAELGRILYEECTHTTEEDWINAVLNDPKNIVSHFVDINNGVQLSEGRFSLQDVQPSMMRCKAFFRPSPKLTLSASGALSICPLMNASEEYGNIHQTELSELLNHMEQAPLFKLHATKEIEQYLPWVDRKIFGAQLDHVCSLRTYLNLLALQMHREGLEPQKLTDKDAEKIRRINLHVARQTGHIKWKTA